MKWVSRDYYYMWSLVEGAENIPLTPPDESFNLFIVLLVLDTRIFLGDVHGNKKIFFLCDEYQLKLLFPHKIQGFVFARKWEFRPILITESSSHIRFLMNMASSVLWGNEIVIYFIGLLKYCVRNLYQYTCPVISSNAL